MVCYAKQQVAAQRERTLEVQIKRFGKSYQRRLRKLVKASSRLGDVLYSFPAAAFALVSGRTDHVRRGEAVRMIRDGAPLRLVGQTLDLPMWTRRLPPEAFEAPLGVFPDSEAFARSVANHIPRDPDETAVWLRWLVAGYEGCDADFALWLARQKVHRARIPANVVPVFPLATYAWFSGLEQDVHARRLLTRPWHKLLTFAAAVDSMCAWFDRMILDVTAADRKRGPGRYSGNRRHQPYSFVPLRTAEALDEEGRAMDHCVGTYAGMVARGECAIYSVRFLERRVATLELRWFHGYDRQPVINQLRGIANTGVTNETRAAVMMWLAQQDALSLGNPRSLGALPIDETRWRAYWAEYIALKGASGIVPPKPSNALLLRLSREVAQLSRGVSSYAA